MRGYTWFYIGKTNKQPIYRKLEYFSIILKAYKMQKYLNITKINKLSFILSNTFKLP